MNREDIIRMAREAGLAWVDGLNGAGYGINTVSDLERFFQAAYAAGAAAATEEANRRANASWSLMCEKMVAAEREANSKVRAGKPRQLPRRGMGILHGEQQHCFEMGWKEGAAAVRAAIRARSNAE
jgi:hypothetical protein